MARRCDVGRFDVISIELRPHPSDDELREVWVSGHKPFDGRPHRAGFCRAVLPAKIGFIVQHYLTDREKRHVTKRTGELITMEGDPVRKEGKNGSA